MGLGGAFLSAAFPGLLKFLIASLEDSLVTAKHFITLAKTVCQHWERFLA
jgi:hypothetical protein